MIHPARVALVSIISAGCNLLVDAGDHHLAVAPDASDQQPIVDASDEKPVGPQPTVLASGQQKPTAIGQIQEYVYWINEADGDKPGALMRVAKAGGKPTVLASGLGNPRGIAMGMNATFFSNDTGGVVPSEVGVFRVPHDGSATVNLAEPDGLGAGTVSAKAGTIFSEAWAPGARARVRSTGVLPSDGGAGCYPYTALKGGGRLPAMVSDDPYLYVVDTAADAIMRAGFGCGGNGVVFAAGQGDARALTRSATMIDWINADSVMQLANKDTNGTPDILLQAQHELAGIALTAEGNVVVTSAADGVVVRIESGGSTTVLASGQSEPHGIAIDGVSDTVFWTNRGSGEIMSLHVP